MTKRLKATERAQRAAELRDAALVLIRDAGVRDGQLSVWRSGELTASLHTPFGGVLFSKPEPKVSRFEHEGLKLMQVETVKDADANLPWGVNVWASGRKVFNIEWNERPPRLNVLTFQRGDWERDLLAACAGAIKLTPRHAQTPGCAFAPPCVRSRRSQTGV